MKKIDLPHGSEPSSNSLVIWLSRTEILLGCFGLVVGGFHLRVTGNGLWLWLGLVLLILGGWHLFRHVDPTPARTRHETDRLYVRLREQLSDPYGMAFDVPVGDETVAYLIVGPAGVFPLLACDVRGRIDGRSGDDQWRITPPGSDDPQLGANPLDRLDGVEEMIRSRLGNELETPPAVNGLVVMMYRNVKGEVMASPRIHPLGEVGSYIETAEEEPGTLSPDDRAIVERALGLTDE